MLTTFHTDHQVLHALRAGASGLLLKDTKPADIVAAIRRVAGGEPMLSPIVTRQLIAHVNNVKGLIAVDDPRHQQARTMLDRHSDRKREVALAVGRGMSNAQISAELYMRIATVKAHVSRVLTKLDLENRRRWGHGGS